MKNEAKILVNGQDLTEDFKTEQDVYLTSTWYNTCKYDNKEFNPEDVRVNGLNEYFIELENEERVYFQDVKVFELLK
jgi:hypothetical protein